MNDRGFESLALELFRYQVKNNAIYGSFVQALGINVSMVERIDQIPFLPIGFFKTELVRTGSFEPALVFESSGTTGTIPSRHAVTDPSLYEESLLRGFELFYGPPRDWCIIGLLPSYLQREHSSLVYMVERLIRKGSHPESGFYLDQYEKLNTVISQLEEEEQKLWLIGVSFALLDWAEKFPLPLQHTTLVETGGMKGRGREMIREELHEKLKQAFAVRTIHSEYGMTELLSQAYSAGEGKFYCPPWMRVLIRDEEDPLHYSREGAGLINIIDLANVYSCSFIATDDLGRLNSDGSFEVLGRMDGSDLRGCSLMVVNGE